MPSLADPLQLAPFSVWDHSSSWTLKASWITDLLALSQTVRMLVSVISALQSLPTTLDSRRSEHRQFTLSPYPQSQSLWSLLSGTPRHLKSKQSNAAMTSEVVTSVLYLDPTVIWRSFPAAMNMIYAVFHHTRIKTALKITSTLYVKHFLRPKHCTFVGITMNYHVQALWISPRVPQLKCGS